MRVTAWSRCIAPSRGPVSYSGIVCALCTVCGRHATLLCIVRRIDAPQSRYSFYGPKSCRPRSPRAVIAVALSSARQCLVSASARVASRCIRIARGQPLRRRCRVAPSRAHTHAQIATHSRWCADPTPAAAPHARTPRCIRMRAGSHCVVSRVAPSRAHTHTHKNRQHTLTMVR